MFLSQFTLPSTYPAGPQDCWETASFKGLSFTYCIMVLHFSGICCQLLPWLLLSEHNGMQFVGLDDEASLRGDSDVVSRECKVCKQQQRLFELNIRLPKTCCHLLFFITPVEKTCIFILSSFLQFLFLSAHHRWSAVVVYSSVYACLTALITLFSSWWSLVINGGRIPATLVESSHQTDTTNNCCQRLANTQPTFFICEFSSSRTEVTLHCVA